MPIHAHTTLFKTKTFWRSGPSFLMGVLHLEGTQIIVIAEIELFPFREAELLIELHTQAARGSIIYESKLVVVNQTNPDEPNMVGMIKIGGKGFRCATLVTKESLKEKSLSLEFLEIENDEQPLQPAPSLKRNFGKPIRSRPTLC